MLELTAGTDSKQPLTRNGGVDTRLDGWFISVFALRVATVNFQKTVRCSLTDMRNCLVLLMDLDVKALVSQ